MSNVPEAARQQLKDAGIPDDQLEGCMALQEPAAQQGVPWLELVDLARTHGPVVFEVARKILDLIRNRREA